MAGPGARAVDDRWWLPYAVLAGFVAMAFVGFGPSLSGELLWDDAEISTENPLVRAPDGIVRLWTQPRAIAHVPLTAATFWVEWRLWGEDTRGYHVVNVLLHALAAFLIWRILRRLAAPGALAAAAVFLVHPVTVASVGWIAERKNTLSLVLMAVAMLCHLRVDDGGGRRWLAAALVAFALALLAKPAVVMLPVVLLGLPWLRRGSLTRDDLVRVLPYFVLAAVAALATLTEHPLSAVRGAALRPEGIPSRLAAAGWVVWFYLVKGLVPVDLMMVYPRWQVDAASPLAWVPLVALVLVAVVAWRGRARWGRGPCGALGYVVLMLVPVLGLVEMSFHRHSLVSDHLQYAVLPGTIALAVGAAATLLRSRVSREVTMALAVLLVGGLAAATWQRAHVYASSRALWADNVRRNPGAWVARTNLGLALLEAGEADAAAAHLEAAVRLDPAAFESTLNLGRLHEERGADEQALAQYRRAGEIGPDRAEPLNNQGEILRRRGDLAGARAAYEAALRLDPAFAEAHNNLGVTLAELGRTADAVSRYREALRLRPGYAEAHTNLGNALLSQGLLPQALAEHRAALALAPESPELLNNLATVLTSQGQHEEAVGYYRRILAIRPDIPQVHHNLATSLLALGQPAEAVRHYEEAVRLAPSQAASRQGLANARAQLGR